MHHDACRDPEPGRGPRRWRPRRSRTRSRFHHRLASALALVLAPLTITSLIPAPTSAESFASLPVGNVPFIRFPVDARGEAMGLAATVDPRGATAFWWNPAPLPQGRRLDVSQTWWEHSEDFLHWRPAAVRASHGNLTFGLVWGRMEVGPVEVRTAYDPDGPPIIVEYTSHLWQLGGAVDLAPWLGRDDAWAWTVGSNLRHVRDGWEDARGSTWDLDVGTSLAWTPVREPEAWLRLHATGMVRNALQGELEAQGEVVGKLARYLHAGMGVEAGVGEAPRGHDLLRTSFSIVWRREWDDRGSLSDSQHYGGELTMAGVLAVRVGYRTGGPFLGGGWSWGIGAQAETGLWRNLRLAVDYGVFDPDHFLYRGQLEHWTVSAGFDLPD